MIKEQREAYVRQLCKDKNYDEAKTAKVVAAAHAQAEADEDGLFDALIELPIKSNADYNRRVDELKTKAAGLDTWHKNAQATLTAEQKKRQELEARLKKAEAELGPLDDIDDNGDGTGTTSRGKRVDMDQINQLIAQRDGHYLNLIADAGDIVARHAKMFRGEVISTRDLLKKVGEAASDQVNPRNITIEDAYLELHGDRVKQQQEADQKATEQRLREEGAKAERERLSRAGMRTGATVPESGIVFDAINSDGSTTDPFRKLTEQDRLNLFEQELRSETDKRVQAEA